MMSPTGARRPVNRVASFTSGYHERSGGSPAGALGLSVKPNLAQSARLRPNYGLWLTDNANMTIYNYTVTFKLPNELLSRTQEGTIKATSQDQAHNRVVELVLDTHHRINWIEVQVSEVEQ
jgi:hypothetical protein